uniref:DUF1214 domain-containing protein n=1 Tax=Bosea sp. NBC_00436 TaxID=2969620 RepID=A0A9E7ZKV0_9HYPH
MRILDLAYILALGGGLGLGTAHWAVAGRPAIGRAEVGAWTAWPGSGSRDVDPYMRAYLARGVHLPLGSGEGSELIAERDDAGQPLDGRCRYQLSGATPTTRGWTIGITDGDGLPFRLPLERTSFTDLEIVRPEDGGLAITASAAPEAGNWLPLPASGRFQIRLRLYDTPISSQTGETRASNLPRIVRVDCR